MSAADPLAPGRHGPAGEACLRIGRPAMDCVQILARRAAPAALADLTLPPPGRAAIAGDLTALSTGPGAWLILSATPGLHARLAKSAVHVSLVDQSHGRALFTLAGPAARDALARLCRLDLHPSIFPAGRVAATPLAGLAGILHHGESGYTLILPSTYARAFATLLAEAATPFGYEAL